MGPRQLPGNRETSLAKVASNGCRSLNERFIMRALTVRPSFLRALALAVPGFGLVAYGPSETVAQEPKVFEALHVFELEVASDIKISPDGRTIVYVRGGLDVMTDSYFSNLWIVNADGTDHRPLTQGRHVVTTPRWSKEGDRIAYISNATGVPQVFVRWMASGEVAQVTHLTEPPSGLAWSPDGSHLAFAKLVRGTPLIIGEMPAPPTGAEWAPPPKYDDRLVFRYDGVGDLPWGNNHLFLVPASGGTARQVTRGNGNFGSGGFSWTPDGRSLVFSSALEGSDAEVYELRLSDGSLTQLTDRVGPDVSPSVSPNGRQIVYLGYDDRLQGFQRTDLYVANRDGSNARSISAYLDRNLQGSGGYAGGAAPQWAPDGGSVYAVYLDKGDAKLAKFSLNGSHEVIAGDVGSGTAAYAGLAWPPVLPGVSFSLAQNGAVAYATTTPHDPGTVVVSRDGVVRRLTAINDDLFAGKELGEVEEIWWESSKDGRRIQGWILKPPGFDPSRKYPLILEIHGGPFLAYGDGFDVEKQLMAAAGYVVLYSNPRGSTSYGQEFGNLIHHAYPGDDFYDLNSGVDAVIERGYVDDDNLFVTGGSGGGVLTAWMIGHTDRFNAALPFYPVINWYSFNLTADMAAMSNSHWFPGLPWDHVEHYESRSLLSVVENVKTPTLIMTGEEDWRTPMSESEQYYKALKLLGVEAVLVRVPGEPHLIWARPSHGISKITTMVGWFDRYRTARERGER